MQLTKNEARLITVARAIEHYNDPELVPVDDASLLASYFPAVLPLAALEKELSGESLAVLVDGFIAGIAANRLMQAGLRPIDIEHRAAAQEDGEYQTGVDPITKEVRVSN